MATANTDRKYRQNEHDVTVTPHAFGVRKPEFRLQNYLEKNLRKLQVFFGNRSHENDGMLTFPNGTAGSSLLACKVPPERLQMCSLTTGVRVVRHYIRSSDARLAALHTLWKGVRTM